MKRTLPVVLPLLLVLAGCRPAAEPDDDTSVTVETPDTAAADHAHGAVDSALEPQPLLPIMVKLGADLVAVSYALVTDDFDKVTESSEAMARHAPISEADLARIRAALGPEMGAFEAADERVHLASVRLHEAAAARDTSAVLRQLADVQSGCVACHAQFRERLRTRQ